MNFIKLATVLCILPIGSSYAVKQKVNTTNCENNICHFNIAQIPDTQGYFFIGQQLHCGHSNGSQINDMYQWFFDKHDSSCPADDGSGKGCYQHIFHVGDIVDGNGGDGDSLWNPAHDTFSAIVSKNTNKIPLGFATGNHDYTGNGPGQGVYQPGNYDRAKDFLTSIYQEQGDYAPKFVPDSQGNPMSPFITYSSFTVGNQSFTALNVPLGMPINDAEFQATQNFIASHSDSLFIINSHTFDGWPSSPMNGKLAQLYQNNKNIFMVLWGHEPSGVDKNGGFAPTPGEIISRSNNYPKIYKYRFDYQESGPYNCNGGNMPQHPLVRAYAFTLDQTNKTLTWQPYDVQAWNVNNAVYKDPAWKNAQSRINLGDKDIKPLDNSKISIKISDYSTESNNVPAVIKPVSKAIKLKTKSKI